MRLTTISLHPGHHVFLDAGLGREIGVVEGSRKTIQDYVEVSGVPLLAEKNYTNVIIRHTLFSLLMVLLVI